MDSPTRPVVRFASVVPCIAWLAACGASGNSGGSDDPPAGNPPPADELALATTRAFAKLPVFESPVLALQAPGDASTWYVVEKAGRVLAFANSADVSSTTTFLDVQGRVISGGEAGLLGMAFHPSYPTDPRVFLSYTTTVNGDLVSRISAFRTTDGGATLARDSEEVLLSVTQPAYNHNGGHVAFGPDDGLLYVGFGDGGGAGDPWQPIGNGQKLTTLLGKILRIDVNGTSGGLPYRIPSGNPYWGNAPCPAGSGAQPCAEIFAYGFRNPWRWSFDRVGADFWVADVGQEAREEVDRVVAGGNYGWRCFEGTQTYNADCGPNAGVSEPPVLECDHDAGQSITGGYVYRGESIPALRGRYVFGDFVTGRLWHVSNTIAPTQRVTVAQAFETGLDLVSFAEDVAGELYVVGYGGVLHRVVDAGTP